jgi:hypothetical protein
LRLLNARKPDPARAANSPETISHSKFAPVVASITAGAVFAAGAVVGVEVAVGVGVAVGVVVIALENVNVTSLYAE